MIGKEAGNSNTSGDRTVAIGFQALKNNTTGRNQVAVGQGALQANTSGLNNVAIGTVALTSNTTGNSNVAIGTSAMQGNLTGRNHIAIGEGSMADATAGQNNVGVGLYTIRYNTFGQNNAAVGNGALNRNTVGSDNVSMGNNSSYNNTEGYRNTSLGSTSRERSTTGNENVAMGWRSDRFNVSGSQNVTIGAGAGYVGTDHSKSGNVMIGYNAGYNESGSNRLYLENSNSSSPLIYGEFDNDILGFNANVGIGTQSPSERLEVVGNISYTGSIFNASDKRFKKDIHQLEGTMAKLRKIDGYDYYMKRKDFVSKNFDDKKHLGLIAQQVETVYPELVKTFDDGYKGVNYIGMIPVLVEAVKEVDDNSNAQIEELRTENAQLKEELSDVKAEIEALKEAMLSLKDSKGSVNESTGNFELNQNHPNPFRGSTMISYELGKTGNVQVEVFNSIGEKVTSLVSETQKQGKHSVEWNATDLPTGTYTYVLVFEGKELFKKAVLIK